MKTASDSWDSQCLTPAPDFRESNIPVLQREERCKGCLTETEEQSAALPRGEVLGTVQAADTWLPKRFKGGRLSWCQVCYPWWPATVVSVWAAMLVSTTKRHFLEELHLGGNPDLASTFPSLVQGCLCQHEAQLSRGWLPWWEVRLEPSNGLGCQAHVSWALSRWPWDASPRALHSELGSHLAKRTGNLDDLELLGPPVLDDFPLSAAPLTA